MFVATGHPVIAGIAFIAAVYHMANHSIFKALLSCQRHGSTVPSVRATSTGSAD